MKIFLDTNILMDVLLARQPFCLHAARLLELCAEGQLDGHVSTIAFPTLAYILRKGHTPEYVRRKLQVLTDIVTPVDFTAALLQQAMTLQFDDLEDAMQTVCARSCAAEAIVTRNIKDFVDSGIPAFAPENFLAMFSASK